MGLGRTIRRIWRSVFRLPVPSDDKEGVKFSRFNFFAHLHPPLVKKEHLKLKHSWCMGGLTFLMFIVSCVSGLVLALYYTPVPEEAYNSITDIENAVRFGSFWRGLHKYSSELMLVTVFLHMLRVVLNRAYRAPREFNWVLGALLFFLVLFTMFTGYLLPYNVRSYDAVSVAQGMADNVPYISGWLQRVLFGGERFGADTLLRFYVLHCCILPLAMILLMALHFWRVRKDGYKGGL
ncbi:MAG: cytochrome b N-terminal domain-containing protein [Planctomycetota bacterium]|nr:cytochrome b N-terminal domain-containing protein [Planctomycetota bacterium]